MHDFLVKEWNLQYEPNTSLLQIFEYKRLERGLKAVLHDRPPAHFRPANALEIHEVSKTMHGTDVCYSCPHSSSSFAFRLPSQKGFFRPTTHQPLHLSLK
jgi:hypothetical protein